MLKQQLVTDNKEQEQKIIQKLNLINQADSQYVQQPYRWVNLIVYFLAAFVNNIPSQTFSPINSFVVEIYNQSKQVVGLNGLIFPIAHPIFAFLINWILDRFGLKIGYLISGLMIIFGCWFRLLISKNFACSIVGSLIIAIGNIFVLNSTSKFANSWFRPAIAPLIITIGIILSLFSSAISVFIPSIIVKQANATNSRVMLLIVIQGIIMTIPFILLMIFFKKQPKVPPSYSSAANNTDTDYKQTLKKLFTNKNYLFILICNGTSYGTLIAIISTFEYFILPFFPKTEVSSLTGRILIVAIAFGLIGAFCCIYVLKKTQYYKYILYIIYSGTIAGLILLPFALQTTKLWAIYLIVAIIGFCIIPTIPILIQLGCQVVFPIGQASSTGFILAAGQLVGFAAGEGFLKLFDGYTIWKVYFVSFCFAFFHLIGIISLFFLKEDLRKIDYEARQVRKSKSISSQRLQN